MQFIPANSIIQSIPPTDSYISRDYNMNIYRGCCHGCVYCDSRSVCYNIENFDQVRAKQNALSLIEKELRAKRKKGLIGTGAMSDPYNPFEKKYELTRGALGLVAKIGFGISLTTKSDLVVRDIDILRDIVPQAPSNVQLTITTSDDALAKKIEPHAPPSSARLRALEKLSAAGLYTGVFVMPVLPYITDDIPSILSLIGRCADAGARNIICFPGMTLRAGNREYYYKALDRDFPGVSAKYKAAYGERYECAAPDAENLWEQVRAFCKSRGLAYTFPKINAQLRALWPTQLTLF